MALKLPKNYANVPASGLYDKEFPDPLFRTLAQLCGLAWKTKGERIPAATVLELAEVRNITERQMYTHLKELKARGCIRVENLGHGQIVIYPLRWTEAKDTVLSSKSDLSDEDLEALAATEETFSNTEEECNNHDVDSESPQAEDQQHHDSDATAEKNFSDITPLSQLAAVFERYGANPEAAHQTAAGLIECAGPAVCAQQLAVFEQRCEQARKTKRGLESPAGLLVDSIKGNWPLPRNGAERKPRRWYTDEEAAIAAADVKRRLAEMQEESRQ